MLTQEEQATGEELKQANAGAGVLYVCGDCGEEQVIRNKDAVRCRRCGYRILYKVRTKRLIQFEAR